ncbi:MAG: hypothetical protein IJC46_07580 [Clostridia bacterium]|nr:hypothetical protein [Clostridia bacterium]
MKVDFKGILFLMLAALLMGYTGSVYRVAGFGLELIFMLAICILAVSTLVLMAFRRVGTLLTWLMLGASLLLIYATAREAGTSLLIWSLSCGTALASSVFWPSARKIRPLAQYALPAAAVVWLGGALGYCKLHLGRWHLASITRQIGGRYYDLMEEAVSTVYGEKIPAYLQEQLELLREGGVIIGFMLVALLVYLLFGCFFLSVWLADRSMGRKGRWLGSWETLIPGRGISMVFMLVHFLGLAMEGGSLLALTTALNLFGYFYVFTALYRLHCRWRKKNMNAVLRGGAIALLFALSLLSVGGSMLSVYTVAMYVGWFIASTPRVQMINRK